MKKCLTTLIIGCAMIGTTTLSAASYWETILEYLPDWRDFVPGMARPQIEEAQPAKPAPKARPVKKIAVKPKPRSVAKTKSEPAPKIAAKTNLQLPQGTVAQPEPVPMEKVTNQPKEIVAKPPVEESSNAQPVSKVNAKIRARQAKQQKLLEKKAVIQKPVSEPISHPSKVAPSEMVLSLNFEKGMQALSGAMAKAPFVEKKNYNKNIMSGVLCYVNILSKQAKSKPFSKICVPLTQSYKDLFPPQNKKPGRKYKKPAEAFGQFQKSLTALGQAGKQFEAELLTNTFKTTLTQIQKTLKGKKMDAANIYGQLVTMQILASHSGHSSAIQLKRLLIPADNFRAKRKDSKVLATNIVAVLQSL